MPFKFPHFSLKEMNLYSPSPIDQVRNVKILSHLFLLTFFKGPLVAVVQEPWGQILFGSSLTAVEVD